MLLVREMSLFSLFVLGQNKTIVTVLLNECVEKKETFLSIKNRAFQTPKNRIFPKVLIHAKNANFFFI